MKRMDDSGGIVSEERETELREAELEITTNRDELTWCVAWLESGVEPVAETSELGYPTYRAEVDRLVDAARCKFWIDRSYHKQALKKLRYVFTNPKGARKNLDVIEDLLEDGHTVEIFGKNGRRIPLEEPGDIPDWVYAPEEPRWIL